MPVVIDPGYGLAIHWITAGRRQIRPGRMAATALSGLWPKSGELDGFHGVVQRYLTFRSVPSLNVRAVL